MCELDIKNFNDEANNLKEKLNELNNEYNITNKNREKVNFDLNNERKKLIDTNNKIEVLENNIASMNKIPYSVRSILESPTLRGIHNILGNLIETKDEYMTMLDVALGASFNNIVVDDESCAKEAIEYLKSHNKGRATFFPLNVIKPKSIEPEILRDASNIVGFIDVASSLVTYDSKYYNIVMNQLGNIIVASNINTAIQISKKINHRYRVISLDGEIIHVGGIMTGGSLNKNNSFISDKYELDKLKLSIDNINENIKSLDNQLSNYDNDLDMIKNKVYNISLDVLKNNEKLQNKENELDKFKHEFDMIKNEINNLTDKSLDNELNKVIEEYYNHEQRKLELEHNLEIFNKEKLDTNSSLNELETSIKKLNSEYNNKNNEINTLEIDITKLNMNLDTLLNRLSEDYNLG